MAFPPAENISHEDFVTALAQLNILLSNLPEQLPSADGPSSRYGAFLSFGLDADILDRTGDKVATLGEQLEHILAGKHELLVMVSFPFWSVEMPFVHCTPCSRSITKSTQITMCSRNGLLM